MHQIAADHHHKTRDQEIGTAVLLAVEGVPGHHDHQRGDHDGKQLQHQVQLEHAASQQATGGAGREADDGDHAQHRKQADQAISERAVEGHAGTLPENDAAL